VAPDALKLAPSTQKPEAQRLAVGSQRPTFQKPEKQCQSAPKPIFQHM